METNDIIENQYNNRFVANEYYKAIDEINLWKSEKIMFFKYIKKTDKILDIGCGTGRTTFNLFKLGYVDIVGFDLSKQMIENAKKYNKENKLNLNFICGSILDSNLGEENFDSAIFSFNGFMTIPTLKSRTAALIEINKLLKKGGIFIFTTHDIENKLFLDFWANDKQKWVTNTQDKRLHEYGDMIFVDNKSDGTVDGFVHVPQYKEILDMIDNANFTLVEKINRSAICEENEAVNANSGECIFWVIQK